MSYFYVIYNLWTIPKVTRWLWALLLHKSLNAL